MDSTMLDKIQAEGVEIEVQKLDPPRTFDMAADTTDGKRARLICSKAACLDVELHIRHVSALKLRYLRWLISDQRLGEPLLRRPVLERLGLNTRDILAAAAERFAGCVDATLLPVSDHGSGEGRVSRVLDGVFHADGGSLSLMRRQTPCGAILDLRMTRTGKQN